MSRNIIIDGSKFNIQPYQIDTNQHFFSAFNNVETEVSANYIVMLCKELGGWFPFTREQIEAVYQKAGHKGFTFNRLIDPQMVPPSLVRAFAGHHDTPIPAGGGWIILDAEGKHWVTDDFVKRCFDAAPVPAIDPLAQV